MTRPESQKLLKKMARECLHCTLQSCGPAAQVPCLHPILQHIDVYKFRIARMEKGWHYKGHIHRNRGIGILVMTVHTTERNQVLEFAECSSHLNFINTENYDTTTITIITSNITSRIIPMNCFQCQPKCVVCTLDSGLLGWLSVAIYSDPDVSEACDTLHWCVTFLRNARYYCPLTLRHIPHDQNHNYSPVKISEFAHSILYSGICNAGRMY